ncbi:MAG: DUF1127 domain-containing protein [Paracoccaceae bacterium]
MAFFTVTQSPAASLAHRFQAWKEDMAYALERRRVYNQTYKELASLSNKDLADIGLNWSNIRSVAFEAAYGKS